MLDHDELADAISYNARHKVAPSVAAAAALVAAWHGAEAYSPADPTGLALLVANWQTAHGLVEDGKLGPATAANIDAAITAPKPPAPKPALGKYRGEASADRAMLAVDFVARHPVYYGLGCGGNPRDDNWPEWPWDERYRVDCSAFTGWTEGEPRNVGGWNTDKILRDAVIVLKTDTRTGVALEIKRGKQLRYRLVDIGELVERGDVFVFGGKFANGVRTSPGHVGKAVQVPKEMRVLNHDGLGVGMVKGLLIAHSSPGNSRRLGEGHAIAATEAHHGGWHHRGFVLRQV